MTSQIETEWESEKSLPESMRYMLDNKLAADVCFEVGPPGGEIATFHAHKCILMSRSIVFEAMFSSGMAECKGPEAKVRVEDIDADIFKEFLNYIYGQTISVSPDSVVYLMYAAKKYMLPELVRNCGKHVSKSLNVSNVIFVLNVSFDLDDTTLRTECLKLISVNAKAVLTGEEILSASRQAMAAILEAETMSVRELVIYETAVNWAKHQLQSAIPGENLTDLQIRETLGDLLYKIHFPAMKPSEFAEITLNRDILNSEEKYSVFYYMATLKKHEIKFPTDWRIGEENFVDRTLYYASKRWQSTQHVDAINFTTNEEILLTGIGVFTAHKESGYDADVEVLQAGTSLYKKRISVPYSGDSVPHKIALDDPILVSPGDTYSIKVMAQDVIGHYSHSCQPVCTKETVTFKFTKHSESVDTDPSRGQIPRLYFCVLH